MAILEINYLIINQNSHFNKFSTSIFNTGKCLIIIPHMISSETAS